MDTKALRQKILDLAIRGKLVPQDPNDEPASVLLERIREQKQQMVKEGKLKKKDIKNDSVIFVGEDNLHYEKFADGSVKCIEDEIPFDVPKGWAWTRLDSISEIITKGASPKWQGVDYTTSGTLFVTSENVGNETLLMDSPKYLSDRINEIQPRSVLKKHDILTNIVGASIGRTCEYTLDALANTNQAVAIIRLVDLRLVDFIVKCLSSAYSIDLMLKNQVNVARANLSLSSLAKFLIPIPPFIEKERIMKKVSLMFIHIDAISENKTDLETTISMAKSKILDLAIRGQLVPQNPDDEPASVLLDRIRAEKEELIKQGKIKRDKKESTIFKGEDNSYYEKISDITENIDDIIPFEIPVTWQWCRGYTCFAGMESKKPTGDFFDYIDIDSIDNNNHKIKEPKHIPVSEAPSRANRAVQNGSVLFSLVRPYLENIALIDEKYSNSIASTGFYVCNSTGALYPVYMFFLMVSGYVVKGLNRFMKGDNSPSINKDNIENWLYPIPPFEEQQIICQKIKSIFSEIEVIEKSLS